MKKYIKQATLLLLISMFFSVGCKKDDNSSSNSTSVLNNTIQQGAWRITYFNDSDNDQTNHYTGYTFQFISNGTVTATNNGSNLSGTWSNGNDDSTAKLVLNFSVNPFAELNDDWHVTQQTSTIIKLEHVSGGNGGTDYLTFEKN